MLLPFNAYPDVPMQVSVTTGVGTRQIYTPRGPVRGDVRGLLPRRAGRHAGAHAARRMPIDNMKVLDALFRSEKSGGWEKVS